MPEADAELVVETEADARIIGEVTETENEDGTISIRGLEL